MPKKIDLDAYEQDIEDHIDELRPMLGMKKEIARIKKMATVHLKHRKSITLRIRETDLEVVRLKASKLGVPYQTYINMLIHKDATNGTI